MIAPSAFLPTQPDLPESARPIEVPEAEYHRLLGYPPGFPPTDRARELAQATRAWYGDHGRPWRYYREASLSYGDDTVWIDGVPFHSPGLRRRFESAGVDRVVLAAVSAGAGCEQRARTLWDEGKPDEYFFLEAYGSAVVEALIAQVNAKVCARAERDGRRALPHYSPGYTDWDITEQAALLRSVQSRLPAPLPEDLRVLASGMLTPRKAMLGVIGLTARSLTVAPGATPCLDCSFNPCQYRRAPYRHQPAPPAPAATPGVTYRIAERALRKWAGERIALEKRADGAVLARFRFEGTTCSNLGHPITLDYELDLGPAGEGRIIRRATCRPAPGDEGFRKTCAYLSGPETVERALTEETPRAGVPLAEAVATAPGGVPAGCTCTTDGRAHKWSMALQAIHFALTHSP